METRIVYVDPACDVEIWQNGALTVRNGRQGRPVLLTCSTKGMEPEVAEAFFKGLAYHSEK
jgi:hypothetical protein